MVSLLLIQWVPFSTLQFREPLTELLLAVPEAKPPQPVDMPEVWTGAVPTAL